MFPRPPGRSRAFRVASKVSHSVHPCSRFTRRSLWTRHRPVWKSKSWDPSRAGIALLIERTSLLSAVDDLTQWLESGQGRRREGDPVLCESMKPLRGGMIGDVSPARTHKTTRGLRWAPGRPRAY